MPIPRLFVLVAALAAASSCTSAPAVPTTSNAGLTAPAAESPADSAAVAVLRPTLLVRNGASEQGGTRLYEFQMSDRSDFSTSGGGGAFAVVAHKSGVPEGTAGTTSFTPDFDLQPATRLYWRARLVVGAAASDWTPTRNFTTPVAGYNRAGELYDPLVNGSTVGVLVGSTAFLPGRGVQLNDGNSYVRYQLVQPINDGEFSMEVEGLRSNGPGAKLKVFSMSDGTGDLFRSNYLLVAQYRGRDGNPDNSIAYKALLGDPNIKLEPDFGQRTAGVMALDPARTYFWKGTWSNFFRLQVQEGIGGRTIYDQRMGVSDLEEHLAHNPATYNPSPHFAYLGANNGPYGEEEGTFPNTIFRNVWIGRGSRPASLGSALRPPQE